MNKQLSVNQLAQPLLQKLLQQSDLLQLGVSRHEAGCTIVDAGIQHAGSAEAGRLIAEICMGGLGEVMLQADDGFAGWKEAIAVTSNEPVLACLASQYAGWALSHEKFFSLGSGPARALAQREELFKELAYVDSAASTCIVLETDKIPPQQIIVAFSHKKNSTGRRIPADDAKPGCFWGFPKEFLIYIHKLAGVEVEEEKDA